MAFPSGLVNRIYGWFPFPIQEHFRDTSEGGDVGDSIKAVGPGTYLPFGVADPNILTFLFWRVKSWEIYLSIAGENVASGTCLDVNPPHGSLSWSYSQNVSGELSAILDLSTSDHVWGDTTSNPLDIIGVGESSDFHILKKSGLAQGSVDFSWNSQPNCAPTLPTANDPAAFQNVYLALFTSGYNSGRYRILKKDDLYYPQIDLYITNHPLTGGGGSSNGVALRLFNNATAGGSVGSLDVQDITGASIGTIPLYTFECHWDTLAITGGYLKVDSLW
jgi:hypothetical protein